jgi:YidC/Oxa1 family membrane protein insertase
VALLDPLYNAVSWVLLTFHTFWSHIFRPTSGASWALSIVMLVVVIRIILIPLFVKQIKAQRGLQQLQPQMKAIQTKYKNDRQKQSEELMKLYKETGTNPLSSCLPLVVQAPFFFALFHVLSYVAQGRPVGVITNMATVHSFQAAKVFGAPISQSFTTGTGITKVVAAIFIVLMSATTFLTQRQLMVKNMPTGQSNPMMQQQKILLYVFPLIFAFFGIRFPIGVLIYWMTTNLWTMGQQFYVIRRNPTPGSEAHEDLQRRRAEKEAAKKASSPALPGGSDAGLDGSVELGEADSKPVRQQPKRESRAKRSGSTKPESGSTKPDSGPQDSKKTA